MPDGIVLYGEDDHATSFIELFPVIEHLVLCARNIWLDCFIRGVVPRDVASSLVHLKYLYLEEMCFLVNEWLRFLVLMIVSSPNLEKLKLVCFEEHSMGFDDDLFSVTMRECSDIWLEHLIELEIDGFGNKKPYLEFVKLILAKSPVLKKLRLKVDDNDEVLKLLEALLPFPRASQVVEIIVKYGGGNNIVIHPVEIHVKEVVSQISFRPSNQ
ncbi:F-box/FBD/LRR-repeat protein At1g13570-like [Rutidosis leptorrhynchoides]|uniref:F-box/FBD/LRR-repeat protein At1g13570-like n=1 Tax=Rutidosis leptorrhynchoides TaxID=125765 RepID=UPI003A9A070B